MKQLILGPRLNKDGVTIGGSEVLFENWLAYCDRHGFEYELIDINKFNYKSLKTALLSIFKEIWRKSPKCDLIFFHGSKNDYFFISPILALIAKMRGKPYFMKKFGGDFDREYMQAPFWKKVGVKWSMSRANGLYWETKRLMPFGKKINYNSIWCPNIREDTKIRRDFNEPYSRKKFVFMSHVRKEKGIDELLEAFRKLGPDYEVDIYGSLIGYDAEQLEGRYKGVVDANMVPQILSKYQTLLLPSWKEGYPGIIIEAFNVGLPVVASNIGGIPEMIEDGNNGVLFEAHSADRIVEAIKRLEKMDFQQLSRNAYSSFSTYDAEIVNAKIITTLTEAIK